VAPPLILVSVFFLAVSATCHFPLHQRSGSHVPCKSLYRARAAYTPAAVWAVDRLPSDWSWKKNALPVSTAS